MENFKKPNSLQVPQRSFQRIRDGKRGRQPQIKFIRMMQENANPLGLTGGPKGYTREEVAQHNTREDCWIILGDKVYDITMYIDYHPGGDIILEAAGSDANALFNRYHPWVNTDALIRKLQVGYLVN